MIFLLKNSIFSAQNQELITYFKYSKEELATLKNKESNFHITKENLQKWDRYISKAFKEAPASLTKLRLFTYLYVAQNDAAALSHEAQKDFIGTLDPLAYQLVQLFLPSAKKIADFEEDEYSKELARIVIGKIRERKEKEDDQQVNFQVPKELKEDYYIGLDIAKWLPWYTIPTSAFWPPPPPSDDRIWEEELKQLHREHAQLTEEKKQAIYLWAGMQDPNKSDWRAIANSYLFTHNIPLKKIIQVRFVLMVGLYDAFIVSFQSKYEYLVLRPSMKDPTLAVEIAVPKHPSYPSNHSLTSALAATVLSYFFPSESSHWNGLVNEAGLSRIWAGIHYPIDDQEGRIAGETIGKSLLKQIFNSGHSK